MALPPTICCKRSSYCKTLDTHPRTIPSSHIHVALFRFLCFLIWKCTSSTWPLSLESPNSIKPLRWLELGVCKSPTLGSHNSENFSLPSCCWRWFFPSIIIAFKSKSSFRNSPSTLSWRSTTLIKSTILLPLFRHPYTSKPSLTKELSALLQRQQHLHQPATIHKNHQ